MAAVLEYLSRELLELAVQVCKKEQKQRINQHHIKAAFEMDEDFKNLSSKMGIQSSIQTGQKKRAANQGPVPT